ncbi:hypothetical protein ccbrp13_31300 [Ktedonobacteria bacterium brp13]|nr:hypothetical protein ccbrp13_31300 [Ktedonobacteria bacterium brp13]
MPDNGKRPETSETGSETEEQGGASSSTAELWWDEMRNRNQAKDVRSPGKTHWKVPEQNERMLHFRLDGTERQKSGMITREDLVLVWGDPERHRKGWVQENASPKVRKKAANTAKQARYNAKPDKKAHNDARQATYDAQPKNKARHTAYFVESRRVLKETKDPEKAKAAGKAAGKAAVEAAEKAAAEAAEKAAAENYWQERQQSAQGGGDDQFAQFTAAPLDLDVLATRGGQHVGERGPQASRDYSHMTGLHRSQELPIQAYDGGQYGGQFDEVTYEELDVLATQEGASQWEPHVYESGPQASRDLSHMTGLHQSQEPPMELPFQAYGQFDQFPQITAARLYELARQGRASQWEPHVDESE